MPKKLPKRPPAGYTYKYVWPDSDYATHRRKVLVKKKKSAKAKKVDWKAYPRNR